jgi:hypothetical protein
LVELVELVGHFRILLKGVDHQKEDGRTESPRVRMATKASHHDAQAF